MIAIIIFSLFMIFFNTDAAWRVSGQEYPWFVGESVKKNCDNLRLTLKQACMEIQSEAVLPGYNEFILQACPVTLTADQVMLPVWHVMLPACKVVLPACHVMWKACDLMLHACDALSNHFQKGGLLRQLDTKVIMYLLCQKSANNAKELAKTFMVEGAKVMEGQITLFDALGRCVPEVQSREEVRTALSDFPSVKNRDAIVGNVMNNYSEHTGSKRFFVSLECVFGKTPCVAPTPDPTILGQEHPWCAGASVQKYYQIMQTNLQNCGIIVEHSFMLRICSMFPHVFPDQLHLMKRELDLIMYILCKESSTNTEKLAETFIAEEGGLQQGVSTLIDAFGRCVPEVGCEDIANVLDNYPTGELRIYKKVFRGIIKRYTHKEGAKRFLPSIKNLVDFMCECIDFWPW